MNTFSTRDALDHLLEGHKLSPPQLEDFIQRLPEDQYLDYKDGSITSKGNREHGKKIIREYVSGFANSEGGILMVGITDRQPRCISPCEPPGNEPLDKWAEGLLFDIAPYLAPPPRIQSVDHPNGPVLIIAVARAGELIPCIEARQHKYFLRINQSTIEVPPFLISDLVLGRRRHPILELTAQADQLPPYAKESQIGVKFYFSAENVGLTTAEQLEIGIISWTVSPHAKKVNTRLLSYIDLVEGQGADEFEWNLRHETARPKAPEITRLPAFNRVGFEALAHLPYPFVEAPRERVAALYLLAKSSPPLWFEMEFRCKREHDGIVGDSRPVISECIVTRVIGRRPRVLQRVVEQDRKR